MPGSGGGNCDCSSLDDACNNGVCKAGKCVAEPKTDGTKCDDGDFCTDDDTCHAGMCIGGNPHKCPDKDACHPGTCDKQTQKCSTDSAPDGTACDDGNPCDNTGSCMGGSCQTGSSKCNDPPYTTACGTGFCVENVGCKIMPMNDGGSCTDGIAPECATGACGNGKCKATPIPGTDGMSCDGGKFCIVGTACMAGECTGGVKRTCPSPDTCSPAECDEQHDVCNVVRKPDGTACNDGDLCHQGMTCKLGVCKDPTHTITSCTSGDKCCPTGCSAQADNDCFYWKKGVQQAVPTSALLGWTQCFFDTYDDDNYPIQQMQSQCNGSEILLGCGQYDPAAMQVTTLQLAAMGLRADVLPACGDTSVCGCSYDPDNATMCVPPTKNGVGFYFLPGTAWGFVRGGDPIEYEPCDFADNAGFDATSPFRMCVHAYTLAMDGVTKTFSDGFRCGEAEIYDNSYARVAYTSSLTPPH